MPRPLTRASKFNPRATEPQISNWGDTYNPAGKCSSCKRPVFSVTDGDRQNEPDPRGFAGPRHSLSTFEEFPGVPFCWNCINENGLKGDEACRAIAEKASAANA